MIITIIILSLLVLALGWTTWNLYSQVSVMEEFIKKTNKREEKLYNEVENYYKIFLGLFTEAYSNMQRIDKRGSFSSDDEVGFAFKVIYNSIQEVQNKLETLRIDDDQEEEK
jgi:hypothetical protein